MSNFGGAVSEDFLVPTTSRFLDRRHCQFLLHPKGMEFGSPSGDRSMFPVPFFFEFDDVVEAFKQKPMMLETLLGFKISLNIFQTIWSYWIFQKQKGAKKKLLNYSKSQHLYTMFCFQKKTTPKNTWKKKHRNFRVSTPVDHPGWPPPQPTPPVESLKTRCWPYVAVWNPPGKRWFVQKNPRGKRESRKNRLETQKSNLNSKVLAGMGDIEICNRSQGGIMLSNILKNEIGRRLFRISNFLGSVFFNFSQMVFAEFCPSTSVTSNSSVEWKSCIPSNSYPLVDQYGNGKWTFKQMYLLLKMGSFPLPC